MVKSMLSQVFVKETCVSIFLWGDNDKINVVSGVRYGAAHLHVFKGEY